LEGSSSLLSVLLTKNGLATIRMASHGSLAAYVTGEAGEYYGILQGAVIPRIQASQEHISVAAVYLSFDPEQFLAKVRQDKRSRSELV
jgi:hypothetical protein